MLILPHARLAWFLILLLAFPGPATIAHAANSLLGDIEFPNSGDDSAQPHFIEGMLFLHNFEYRDAARAFRRAQDADPDFALAYWGEAMTHNRPIWMQQDREAALTVMRRLAETPEGRMARAATPREKELMYLLEILYGTVPETREMSKEERDDAYRDAWADLHRDYPDDQEIAVFHGLSILGTAHEGRDFAIYMKAAAELLDVWYVNRDHPGAAHYLIHSFDDPVHAPLGLPMARAYSKIAPDAAHAQHMTSHIFLALGMWEQVVDANLVAHEVRTRRQTELGEPAHVCDHYPWWLQYAYLQSGQMDKAARVLETCTNRVRHGDDSEYAAEERWHYTMMRAHQIVDSERWNDTQRWDIAVPVGSDGSRNHFFASAYAAIKRGNVQAAESLLENLERAPESERRDIQIDQVAGLLQIARGQSQQGLALLERAEAAEHELPISYGPPTLAKPTSELLGDVYRDLGRHAAAANAYERQLSRTPNRRLSRLGLRQALRKSGDDRD